MSRDDIKSSLKLDADIIARIFSPIRNRMSIPNDYYTGYGITKYKINNSWEDALREGIEIKPGDSDFTINEKTGELLYKGVKVLLYIRDQNNYTLSDDDIDSYHSEYKFHIAYCSTLESMQQQGKYEKYVVSTRNDGIFLVRASNGRKTSTLEQELKVCKNCLRKLNYKNYKNVSPNRRNLVYKEFSLEEFFSVAGGNYRFVGTLPRKTEKSAPVNEYTADWNEISNHLRKIRRWRCQECGKDCSRNHGALHVHHLNGIKSDNNLSNLIVLCTECHIKEHNHMRGLNKKIEQDLFDL